MQHTKDKLADALRAIGLDQMAKDAAIGLPQSARSAHRGVDQRARRRRREAAKAIGPPSTSRQLALARCKPGLRRLGGGK